MIEFFTELTFNMLRAFSIPFSTQKREVGIDMKLLTSRNDLFLKLLNKFEVSMKKPKAYKIEMFIKWGSTKILCVQT